MSEKKALITGITGQDGSYLAELLLKKDYEVHGIIRKSSSFNTGRIDHLYNDPEILDKKLFLHYGDVVDTSNLNRLIEKVGPDEIYNLAAQSHVKVSFELPDYTAQVDGLGTLRFLDAIREAGLGKQTKFYQASTSELFGKVQTVPQNEQTPFYPRSPYGVAKLYGFWIVKNYREAYNIFASNGILFNHESPRRGETFVTRKVTRGAARIILGIQDKLLLGNLEAKRDWGYAPEYCEGMWAILQQDEPGDYVLSTGETHSVRELCELTFSELGITIEWQNENENEKGIAGKIDKDRIDQIKDKIHKSIESEIEKANHMIGKSILNFEKVLDEIKPGKEIISIDPNYYRPTEVDLLIGDSSKAKEKFDWNPKTKFNELIKIMTQADLERVIRKGY